LTDEELMAIAKDRVESAYAPFSGLKVGAALEADDGDVYTGSNVENSSYGLSCCAERNAIFAAVGAGRRRFKRMAIACNADLAIRPCGACLQVMWEFAPEMVLLLAGPGGALERRSVRDLLPEGFVLDKGGKHRKE
jgi:cytidine deaminase